jgi:hypothetical protein
VCGFAGWNVGKELFKEVMPKNILVGVEAQSMWICFYLLYMSQVAPKYSEVRRQTTEREKSTIRKPTPAYKIMPLLPMSTNAGKNL